MAATNPCLASMARIPLANATRPTISSVPRFLAPSASQTRHATQGKKAEKAPRKLSKDFKSYDVTKFPQFSLCDAMRYLRAYEVGRPPHTIKYEVAIRLKTPRNGPVVKNRVLLPNPVKSDIRIGVICPEGSQIAEEAKRLGAVVAGQESVFEQIRSETFTFNRLICHTDSEVALNKAALGKILGPKGLMPNKRMKSITSNINGAIREAVGADNYRERQGAIRLAVGQLGFTPKMLADNVKAFVANVKTDLNALEGAGKEVREVVLSSSHGPGFSLNGNFNPTDDKIQVTHLASVM